MADEKTQEALNEITRLVVEKQNQDQALLSGQLKLDRPNLENYEPRFERRTEAEFAKIDPTTATAEQLARAQELRKLAEQSRGFASQHSKFISYVPDSGGGGSLEQQYERYQKNVSQIKTEQDKRNAEIQARIIAGQASFRVPGKYQLSASALKPTYAYSVELGESLPISAGISQTTQTTVSTPSGIPSFVPQVAAEQVVSTPEQARIENLQRINQLRKTVKDLQDQGAKTVTIQTSGGVSKTVPVGSAYREIVKASQSGTVTIQAKGLPQKTVGLISSEQGPVQIVSEGKVVGVAGSLEQIFGEKQSTEMVGGNIAKSAVFATKPAGREGKPEDILTGMYNVGENIGRTIGIAFPVAIGKEITGGFGAGQRYYEKEFQPTLKSTALDEILSGQPSGLSQKERSGSIFADVAITVAPLLIPGGGAVSGLSIASKLEKFGSVLPKVGKIDIVRGTRLYRPTNIFREPIREDIYNLDRALTFREQKIGLGRGVGQRLPDFTRKTVQLGKGIGKYIGEKGGTGKVTGGTKPTTPYEGPEQKPSRGGQVTILKPVTKPPTIKITAVPLGKSDIKVVTTPQQSLGTISTAKGKTKAEKATKQFFAQQEQARKRRIQSIYDQTYEYVYEPILMPSTIQRRRKGTILSINEIARQSLRIRPKQTTIVREKQRQAFPPIISLRPRLRSRQAQPVIERPMVPEITLTKQIFQKPIRQLEFGRPKGGGFFFPFGGGSGGIGGRRTYTRKKFIAEPVDPLRAGVLAAAGVERLVGYNEKVFKNIDKQLAKARKRKGATYGIEQPMVGKNLGKNLTGKIVKIKI